VKAAQAISLPKACALLHSKQCFIERTGTLCGTNKALFVV